MSTAAEPPLPQPSLDLLEESRIYAQDPGGSWVAISTDATGQLQTALSDALQSEATDELRTRVFGPDAGGVLQQANAEQFSVALAATDVGLATYGDRSLRTLAQDHVQTVLFGEGAGGALQEVGVEAFNSAAAVAGFALLTYGDRALQTQAADELRTRLHDSLGTQIDPATAALENALQANATDEFRARAFGPDGGGVLQAVNAEQFSVALAATDVGLATYGDRALASLAQDEWIARTADSTGAQQDLQQTDSASGSAVAIGAGGSNSTGLSAPGASKLRGRVVNDAQYDVDIQVLDASGGTVLFTINVATNVAAGTETPLDEVLESPHINVVITNDGAAQSAATFSYHLVGGN